MANAIGSRSFVYKFVKLIQRFFDWLHFWMTVLKPCRFSLLMVIIGAAILLTVPQGTDLLRDLAERISGNSVNNWIRFSFFTSVLIWAVCSWYWSRVMLFLCFPGVPGNDYKLLKFRKWVPRCIGFAAALSIAAALVKASFGYDSRNDYASILLLEYAGETLVSALIFLYVVSNRRDWMISAYKSLQSVRILQRPIVSPFVSFLNVQPAEKLEYGIKDVGELPTSVKVVTCATFFGAVFLFLLFLFTLQQTAPLMGTAAIFLFALAGWIAVGSLLDFFGMQLRFPVVTSLLVLATIFSICNDNHTVRTIPTKPVPMENRMDIRHALKTWYQYQLRRASPTGNYPLFIVAAEGGGIRAAYWTANVLSKITDSNPSFPDQLFALSSVSGGSLGSAVFIAQLADAPVTADGFHCDKDGRHLPGARDFQPVTKLILGEDFLSPAVGAMLYPDLVQRFLPFPIDRFDRARALEGAWERAWSKHTGNKRFSEQFDNLWPVGGKTWTPALFLNSTWVETGKRLIVSNLRLTAEEFNDAEDLNSFYTEQSLPLSTAVHLSARFTYISPAGTLKKDGKIYGRAVDGGYFENSGETTVFEILKTIDTLAKKDIRWKKIQPIVIHISNEPVDPKFTNISLGTDKKCKDKASRPRHYLNEALSPPITLLHTRNARGVYARETVKSYDVAYKFFQFGLCRDRMEVPLGWVLSDVIQGQMDKQLVENSCTVFHNSDNLEKINVLLKMRYKQNNVSGQISETPS